LWLCYFPRRPEDTKFFYHSLCLRAFGVIAFATRSHKIFYFLYVLEPLRLLKGKIILEPEPPTRGILVHGVKFKQCNIRGQLVQVLVKKAVNRQRKFLLDILGKFHIGPKLGVPHGQFHQGFILRLSIVENIAGLPKPSIHFPRSLFTMSAMLFW